MMIAGVGTTLLLLSLATAALAEDAVPSRTLERSDNMSPFYSRVMDDLFPAKVHGVGVSFRHFIARLPQQEIPEVAFVVERDILGFQQFGPVHAVLIEPVSQSVWRQIAALPVDVTYDKLKSRVQVRRVDFTEESCPALVEILAAAQGASQKFESWSGQVWHPVRVQAQIKTSASSASFDCTGQCFGIETWATPAFHALKACQSKGAPPK